MERPKINLASLDWEKCECGGQHFRQSMMVKRLSALISPDGQERIVPVEIMLCESCNLVPGFISKEVPNIPENMKAKTKILS